MATENKDTHACKNYLLAIGIDEYEHCPKLRNAVKDARDIVEVLKSRYRFEAEHIQELYDANATKANIFKAFERLANAITPSDNFLLYFSGHGEFKQVFNSGYWIPVEAKESAVDQYIPNSDVRTILSAIKSHHTFLMVDSCFSGVLFAQSGSRSAAQRKERDPSRWGLTAGRNEVVTDGSGNNSPFAQSVLYELRNASEPIGVAELCDRVLEVVSANADQTPRGEPLRVEGHQGGQFVFHQRHDETADWAETVAADSIEALESFLEKYESGEHVPEARKRLAAARAEALWNRIEQEKGESAEEVAARLALVNKYVDAYENQPRYSELLDVGQLLEYQLAFLKAQHSEFALRKFIQLPVPAIDGAEDILKKAEAAATGFEEKGNAPSAVAPKTPKIPEVEKKATRLDRAPRRRPIPQDNGGVTDNQKRWIAYAVGAVFLAIAIWAGVTMIQPGEIAVPEPYEDQTSGLSGYMLDQVVVIRPQFDVAGRFRDGRAKVSAEGRTFVINLKGVCIEGCTPESDPAADEADWQTARTSGTREGYERYLKKYPNGKYSREAVATIKRFKALEDGDREKEIEEKAWQVASKEGTYAAYREFLANFGSGHRADEARKILAYLSDELEYWEKVSDENSVGAYRKYQEKYPKGQFFATASARIRRLSLGTPNLGSKEIANLKKPLATYQKVSQMPELIGGMTALQKLVRYPEIARKAGVMGTVVVDLFVDESGQVESPVIYKGLGSGCDREALRVVKSAKFKPGTTLGKPVKMKFRLEIQFRPK